MNSQQKILIGAGDAGGARSVLPALHELEKRRRAFDLLHHGIITKEAPENWPRVRLPADNAALRERLRAEYQSYVFATSADDTYPLRIARQARASELPVVCVLDNWMNYRRRLEMDGQPTFMPDVYAVMDKLARDEAISDGIPSSRLRIVGQAALSNLADEYLAFPVKAERERALSQSGWAARDKKLVVFISEPVEKDQGADARSPHYRGYTEKTVLSLLARCLAPFHETVQLGLVPHPREDAEALLSHWENCRGHLQGGQLMVATGRHAVFIAEGVCGMASLLLYEAMLLGKLVLSLQPGLRLPQLEFLRKKGVELFVTDEAAASDCVARWLRRVLALATVNGEVRFDPQIIIHRNAPSSLASLIEEISSRNDN